MFWLTLMLGMGIFTGLIYLIRRVIGTPRVPNDVISSVRLRLKTLIEGTRQKQW